MRINPFTFETLLPRPPDLVQIDFEISVDKPVPHPDDLRPWHFRTRRAALLGDFSGGLSVIGVAGEVARPAAARK